MSYWAGMEVTCAGCLCTSVSQTPAWLAGGFGLRTRRLRFLDLHHPASARRGSDGNPAGWNRWRPRRRRLSPGPCICRSSGEARTTIWKPAVSTTWQWQLDTPVDLSYNAQVYDIHMFDNDAGVVAALHAQGRRVICYISAGSWENWRPDADQFPTVVIGKDYMGGPARSGWTSAGLTCWPPS